MYGPGVLLQVYLTHKKATFSVVLQGNLAHNKPLPPLGPPDLSDAALEVAIARGHDVAARLRDPLQNAVVGVRPL